MKSFNKLVIAGLGCLALIQVVPYGKNHINPPVMKEPDWDSTDTRILVKRACFDCHSNETVWPLYSKIAPSSWLVYHDVVEAREKLNFSEWQRDRKDSENPVMIESQVMGGGMPPIQYRLAHPEARLRLEERKKLVDGIKATLSK